MVTETFKKIPKKSHARAVIELEILRQSLYKLKRYLSFKLYSPRLVHGLLEDNPDRCIQFREVVLNREKEIVLMKEYYSLTKFISD